MAAEWNYLPYALMFFKKGDDLESLEKISQGSNLTLKFQAVGAFGHPALPGNTSQGQRQTPSADFPQLMQTVSSTI